MVYSNQDEEEVADIAAQLEQDEGIKSAIGYSNTLGKAYVAEDLSEVLADMDDDIDFDPALLNILYYDYYDGKNIPALTLSEFLGFLSNDVLGNETFARQMDESMQENIEMMETLSNPDSLQRPMGAAELAGLFGIEPQMVEQLFMAYSAQSGNAVEAMTLPAFTEL